MKIIVGLGNPGTEYAASRHNVGFMFLDALADKIGAAEWREKDNACVAEARLGDEKILLVKPLTYMNNSGEAVAPLVNWYKLTPGDVTTVHDDMDLPVGLVRIRPQGSAGGHNGIKSIIAALNTEKFARLKIGIGHPAGERTTINHVLSPFMPEEREKIDAAIDYLLPAAECLLTEGVDMAMNRYNPHRKNRGALPYTPQGEPAPPCPPR